ncbi:hypothetical protein [Massilimicrobiota sp. An142]|uniref:hypothetical protein n=1 Tax=Massilimicrobiota sp. An142 TaxID=1965564 RepID=UPI00130213F8|nr:hypothetical protein [Massilimicrobiota sp. An142]
MLKKNKLLISKARMMSISVIGILYAFYYSYSYGVSYNLFMLFTLGITLYMYLILLFNFKRVNITYFFPIIFVVFISIINGIFRGNTIDPIIISHSLILPFVLSSIEYEGIDNYKMYIPCCLITIGIVIIQLYFSVYDNFNSNTLGFILYMGGSFSFLWFKSSRNKVWPMLYLVVFLILMFKTDCRNAMVVTIATLLLLVLSDKVFYKINNFRIIYISALIFTIITPILISFIFNNPILSKFINEFIGYFSNKSYGMDLRIGYYSMILTKLESFNILEKMFGMGINTGSGHNLWFQGLFVYGYIGTIIIYIYYIKIFETASRLYIKTKDPIVLGCFIALVGNILLQCVDEYLICNPTCVVIPFLMMGMINSKAQIYKKNLKGE